MANTSVDHLRLVESPPQPSESSEKKQTIPQMFSESQRVDIVRKYFDIPKPDPEKQKEERKTKVEEYVTEKQNQLLANGQGYIDKNKSQIEGAEPFSISATFMDRMKKKVALQTEELKTVDTDAYESVLSEQLPLSYSSLYSKEGTKNLAFLAKELTPDQVKDGMYRLRVLLGKKYLSESMIKSSEFCRKVVNLGKLEQTQFANLCDTLNRYTFLSDPILNNGWDHEEYKTGGSGFRGNHRALLNVIQDGEIPEFYQKRLDAAQRMALLSDKVVITDGKEPAEASYLQAGTPLQKVLDTDISSASYKRVEELAEEVASSNLGEVHPVDLFKVVNVVNEGNADIYLELANRGLQIWNFDLSVSIDKVREVYEKPEIAEWVQITNTLHGNDDDPNQLSINNVHYNLKWTEQSARELSKVGIVFNYLQTHKGERAPDPFTSKVVIPKMVGLVDDLMLYRVISDELGRNSLEVQDKLNGFCLALSRENPAEKQREMIEQVAQLEEGTKFYNHRDHYQLQHLFQKWLVNQEEVSGYYIDKTGLQPLTPDMLFSYAKFDISAFLHHTEKLKTVSVLPDEFKNTISFFDNLEQRYKEKLTKYEGKVEDLIHDGVFSLAGLEYFSKQGDIEEIAEIVNEEYLTHFPPNEQQILSLIARFKDEDDIVKSLVKNAKNPNTDFFGEDGNLTLAFYEQVSLDAPNSVSLISDDIRGLLEGQPENVVAFWEYFLDTQDEHMRSFLSQNRKAMLQKEDLTSENIEAYFELSQRIASSPSQEIQKFKNILITQVIEAADPIQAYEQINDIFVKNNLPTVGKVFRVFEVLYPGESIDGIVTRTKFPPVLASQEGNKDAKRYGIIYRDLLKAQIGSGNRSLRDFTKVLDSGLPLFDRVLAGEALDEKEQRHASVTVKKLQTMQEKNFSGNQTPQSIDSEQVLEGMEKLQEEVLALKKSLGVRENQSMKDRVEEMFVGPLRRFYPELGGIHTLSDISKVMKEVKQHTQERNLSLYQQADEEGESRLLSLHSGDLIKHVNERNMGLILESGVLSREYLGVDAGSDATPLGTDATMVTDEDAEKGFAHAYNQSAKGYGDIAIVVKDRGQFQKTDLGEHASYEPEKYEVYNTAVVDRERHMDIRTGLPSSEIDYIVVPDAGKIDRLCFSIAKQGVYIPIVDQSGKVVFTPEQYYSFRSAFDGVGEYDGKPLHVVRTNERDSHFGEIQLLIPQIQQDIEAVDALSSTVRAKIEEVVEKRAIELADEYDLDITHGQLVDTGSSGRHTNIPGDYDFDLMLLLDAQKIKGASDIGEELLSVLGPTENKSHGDDNGGFQVRSIGSQNIRAGETIDVDVGITSKATSREFATNDAISAKLEWIKEHKGEEVYHEVLANIVLAKQKLKEIGAYKKTDGGFGGVGTETWLLAHGGNMTKAFESFWDAAHQGDRRLSLEEFQKKYKILDAGINLKYKRHDNYAYVLNAGGYDSMLGMIGNYLGKTYERVAVAA